MYRDWCLGECAEEIKAKLISLHEKSYEEFIQTAIRTKFPYKERINVRFRFSDIHSYNYSEIKKRYQIEEELNASLIENENEFISMEYPTDMCAKAAGALVTKSKCQVIISLIGIRSHWESDFLRDSYILVETLKPANLLEYALNEGIDLKKFRYSSVQKILLDQNDNFIIEIWTEKNRKNGKVAKNQKIFRINCLNWKDKTPPSINVIKATDILYLISLSLTRDSLSTTEKYPPVIIHCLAGIGRTGTFIFYTMMRSALLKEEIDKRNILSVFIDLLMYLRSKRTWMVEVPSQLDFLYQILLKEVPDIY